jgi:hypothetical protein
VQDGFENENLRWKHSTGTDFRLTLMPTYLKMIFLPKVTMTLKGTTGKTGCRHWTDITQSWFSTPAQCTCSHQLFFRWVMIKKTALEQFFMAFYRNTDRFFHILIFLRFSDNRNESDKTDKYYDGLWKMRTIFMNSVTHMLNITTQLNTEQLMKTMCCHFQTAYTKEIHSLG